MGLNVLQNILVVLSFIGGIIAQSPCDDWEAYKDETCIKIFNTPGLLNYDDAKAYCISQGVNLMTIDTQPKQDFIEKFLKSNKVADNVWLGLKYSDDNGYQWSDGTLFHYANWAAGNPKNDSSYCVQIHTEEEEYGKWSEVTCDRKNTILCEKLQLWSPSKLQTKVMNLEKNPVPMGFIYVQLPKEKLPSEIWPVLGWKDVTSEYDGLFFRAEGKNSSSFGDIQEENAPRLVNLQVDYHNVDNGFAGNLDLHADNQQSQTMLTGWYIMGNHNSQSGLKLRVSSGEVRPRNTAIRVWKRVD